MSGERRFRGIQVGQGDEILGKKVAVVQLTPEELQATLRRQEPGKAGRLVIDMAGSNEEHQRRINQLRDWGTNRQIILEFPEMADYRKAAGNLADWVHQADIEGL